MARPRVFVSSTYYDLKYVRATLEEFITNLGYEAVLFEKGSIPFFQDQLLETSCISELENCDVFVLIVGGRYGSLSVEDLELRQKDPANFFGKVRSVTQKEYERAIGRSMPMFIFVEAAVLAEYKTYQNNRTLKGITYAHVDNSMIFELIDEIHKQRLGNFVKSFDKITEIVDWLRDQWAGIFASQIRAQNEKVELAQLSLQISQLESLVTTLQDLTSSIAESTLSAGELEHIRALAETKHQKDLAAKVLEMDPVRWFRNHERTKKLLAEIPPNRILEAVTDAESPIDFLAMLGVPEPEIIDSMLGVEASLLQDYVSLRRILQRSGYVAGAERE